MSQAHTAIQIDGRGVGAVQLPPPEIAGMQPGTLRYVRSRQKWAWRPSGWDSITAYFADALMLDAAIDVTDRAVPTITGDLSRVQSLPLGSIPELHSVPAVHRALRHRKSFSVVIARADGRVMVPAEEWALAWAEHNAG